MTIHQIHTDIPGEIKYRELTCYCAGVRGMCDCYGVKSIVLVQKAPTVASRMVLEPEMRKMFLRRLREGYDVDPDPETLSEEARKTHMLWVAFRGASSIPLQTAPTVVEPISLNVHSDSEDNDETEKDRDYAEQDFDIYEYYAVYFIKRSGHSGTYYIGQLISKFNDKLTLKFLQRVGSRSKFYFDWPKREDIATVENDRILHEVKFDAPPPFLLDHKQLRMIEKSMSKYENN
jgi:hypothetical protein